MATYAITRPRPRAWPRHAAGQALAGLLVAAVTGGLTAFQQSHRALDAVAVVIVAGGSAWFATTRRVTLALAVLMLYLGLLDGYLKLATGSSYVTFVRDLLLFSLALGVLLRASLQRTRLVMPPLSAWVVVFVVVVLVQLANPDDGSLAHSLAGVRQHLEFVPLFFLTYTFVRTTRSLRIFVVLLALIGAVNGVVDVVQFKESPQQLASWGPGYTGRVFGTSGTVTDSITGRTFYTQSGQELTRPFGLGSDAGDGGLMGAFAIGAILALASIPGRRRYLALAVIGAALAIAGIITAQGRAVIVCAVAVALAYAVLTATSRRGMATVAAVAVTAVVAFVAVEAVLGSSQSTAVRYSGLSVSNIFQTVQQNRGFSLDEIPGYLVRYPLGAGLGVAGPAIGVSGAPPQAGVLDAENEVSFAIIETGIPGMIALLGFTIAIVALGFRRVRREPDREARVLLAAIVAPVVGMLVVYSVSAMTPTTPGGPYLWAAGGIVCYWLVALPAQRRRAAPMFV